MEALRRELQRYRDLNDYHEILDGSHLLLKIFEGQESILQFEPSAFRNMVVKVKISADTIRFRLINGMELAEAKIGVYTVKKKRYLPFGYQMKNGEIAPHPTEGPLVQAIFSKYLEREALPHLPNLQLFQVFPIGKGLWGGTKSWFAEF